MRKETEDYLVRYPDLVLDQGPNLPKHSARDEVDLQTSLVSYLVNVPILLIIEGKGEQFLVLAKVLGTDLNTATIHSHLEEEDDLAALVKRFTKYLK